MKKTKRNFIGGEWLEGANAADNINPSDTSDIIGEYAHASAAQTQQAIDAAYQASSAWGNSSIQHRSDILDNIGSEILQRREELGELVSREEGKTLPEGIGEATRAGQVFKFFAGEALRPGGEFIDSIRPGLDVSVTRAPMGVVGLILPWNFPIAIPAWKVAPALAYGNAVVFKPAELVPATALWPRSSLMLVFLMGYSILLWVLVRRWVRPLSITLRLMLSVSLVLFGQDVMLLWLRRLEWLKYSLRWGVKTRLLS